MIDWRREQTNENYCGYCIGITSPCNGSCFTDKTVSKDIMKNREDHLKIELERVNERLRNIMEEIDYIEFKKFQKNDN